MFQLRALKKCSNFWSLKLPDQNLANSAQFGMKILRVIQRIVRKLFSIILCNFFETWSSDFIVRCMEVDIFWTQCAHTL